MNNKITTIKLETGEQLNVASKVEICLSTEYVTGHPDKKSLNIHLHDCTRQIRWEVPLNLRGLRKLERMKVAIEVAEKELLSNIEYKEEND